jgi:hypothetical protein
MKSQLGKSLINSKEMRRLAIINRKKVMASIEDKPMIKIPKENMETKTIAEAEVVSSVVKKTNLEA